MYGYIYKTTNLVNEKIYIGKHKHNSFDAQYYGSGKVLKESINKYGIDNFKCELIDCCDSLSELNEKEKYYIKLYNSQGGNIGYNISNGGDGGDVVGSLSEEDYKKFVEKMKVCTASDKNGFFNRHHSEEAKAKISKANKGRKIHFSDEHRKHLSEATRKRIYKPLSQETKAKISQSLKGKNVWSKGSKKSESTRKKNSIASSGVNNARYGVKLSQEFKDNLSKKLKGRVCMYNHNVSNSYIMVKKEDIDSYLETGYKLGKGDKNV